MPKPNRLTLVDKEIFALFSVTQQKVYSVSQLDGMLKQHRASWGLATHTNLENFISFLIKHGDLRAIEFIAAHYDQKITRYSWGPVSIYELALSLKPRAYLCHATAALLHGLTHLTPETIYINSEQSPKPTPSRPPTQDAIDRAFSKEQRQSKLIYECGSESVTVISGKSTQSLGVEEMRLANSTPLAVTNLERTLIDITVRPAYGGGIRQVLDAYYAARDRVSVDQLLAILAKLEHVYPYHQAIGFLMQQAGYSQNTYAKLAALGQNYDFYLAHNMQQPHYSEDWRLNYPRNFDE